MAVTNQVFTIGTAASEVVFPSPDTQRILFENQESSSDLGDYSSDGLVFAVSQEITLANNGTALFSFTTGASGAQFEFWNFTADGSSVRAELIEGATITTTGTAVPAYNLNRNFTDDYDAVLETASALTGGTVVLNEYVAASNQAGGGMSSSKVVTLEPSTEYGFRFTDVGGNGGKLHVQIGWVEKFNGDNDIWLGGVVGEGVRLRGGQKVELLFYQGETLSAISTSADNQLAVLRRD